MDESQKTAYYECSSEEGNFLMEMFKNGISVSEQEFEAFLKKALNKGIQECFPDTSVLHLLCHGQRRYALGYYDVPESSLFTINLIELETDSDGLAQMVG